MKNSKMQPGAKTPDVKAPAHCNRKMIKIINFNFEIINTNYE